MFRVTYRCVHLGVQDVIPTCLEVEMESDPRVFSPLAPVCSFCQKPMVMADVLNLEQRASLRNKSKPRSRPKVELRPGKGFQAEQRDLFK